MSIFKRFEVWMLLIFAAVGVGFVLFTQLRRDDDDGVSNTNPNGEESNGGTVATLNGATDPDQGSPSTATVQKNQPFEVESALLTQDGEENWLLEVGVRFRNNTSETVKLDAEATMLETDAGERVPEFFLPFASAPEVAPEDEQIVDLRYWLDQQHRGQDLWLSILGDRIKVPVEQ